MKKSRSIRVGRKLVFVWRWVRRRRRHQASQRDYSRLKSTSSPPPKKRYTKDGTSMAARVGGWRRFFSRLKPAQRDEVYRDYEVLSERGPKPPPKGHLAVYVAVDGGETAYRAVVPVVFFNHPLFAELLRKAEREFGYQQCGGITIPCPISDFEGVCTVVAAEVGRRGRSSPRLLSPSRGARRRD